MSTDTRPLNAPKQVIYYGSLMQAAERLHEAVKARAATEGVPYELSPDFFLDGLHDGEHEFFGFRVEFSAKELPYFVNPGQSRNRT